MAAHTSPSAIPMTPFPLSVSAAERTQALQVVRRDGSLSAFNAGKISVAISKAFVAVEGTGVAASKRIHDAVETLTTGIVERLERRSGASRAIDIEQIKDQVELALMRSGEHKVARAYVLYREDRTQQRR